MEPHPLPPSPTKERGAKERRGARKPPFLNTSPSLIRGRGLRDRVIEVAED